MILSLNFHRYITYITCSKKQKPKKRRRNFTYEYGEWALSILKSKSIRESDTEEWEY
jgi:hypothetical protein